MIILKKYITLFMMIQLVLFCRLLDALAQNASDSVSISVVGYIDKNKDGINDLFHDANGDGINDVNDRPYLHKFDFNDENKDQVNDLWRDEDGDGVNDLMISLLRQSGFKPKSSWIDMDGDGIRDKNAHEFEGADLKKYVLDTDDDGINDITGLEVDDYYVHGYRYGMIDEEGGKKLADFNDDDGDYMHDRYAKRFSDDLKRKNMGRTGGRNFDYFIDKDGDGICDERGLGGLGRRGSGRRHGKKSGN
ncbi:hypothetical protein JXB12_09110 [candidate division KSB1 bacterium]|nr:hypothetical protein [candidate division KSB1 bacterium]